MLAHGTTPIEAHYNAAAPINCLVVATANHEDARGVLLLLDLSLLLLLLYITTLGGMLIDSIIRSWCVILAGPWCDHLQGVHRPAPACIS